MEARTKTGGGPKKVGESFTAATSAYRAWVKHQCEEGEGWRKMLESSGAEMVREMKAHEASTDAQRTDLQRILRDFDRQNLLSLDEKEEVMFDVLTYHKQRILDEWEEPDEIWTMQAELWAEACAICRIREGTWADHEWQTCRRHQDDVEAVRRAHDGVVEWSELWTIRGQVGFEGRRCVGCKRSREHCWVSPDAQNCRFAGVVANSVAAILGTGAWFVQEWEEQEGRGRGGMWGEQRIKEPRYAYAEAGRVWRTFGWLGVWDITEVKVDNFKEEYYNRFRELKASREGQRRREAYAAATLSRE